MNTLTVTLHGNRLTFDIRVFLGTTYTLAFAGDAAALVSPVLSLTTCHHGVGLAQSVEADGAATLALNGTEIAAAFAGCCGESIGFSAWLSDASGTVGHGQLPVNWSPVVVLDTGAVVTMAGPAGADGAPALMRVAGGQVQWQNDGDEEWTDLISLADLIGPTGQTGATGATGAAGATGATGAQGQKGDTGAAGADGAEVELTAADGYIKWRHSGDALWTNLVALNTLVGAKGDKGDQGLTGATGPTGQTGAAGAAGLQGAAGAPGVGFTQAALDLAHSLAEFDPVEAEDMVLRQQVQVITNILRSLT